MTLKHPFLVPNTSEAYKCLSGYLGMHVLLGWIYFLQATLMHQKHAKHSLSGSLSLAIWSAIPSLGPGNPDTFLRLALRSC
jgi:hypothetical protein